MIITDAQLLEQIDAFLVSTKMAPTRLGLEALSDGGLVKSLRAGRSLSLRNAEKLVNFMAAYQPAEQASAA
jgi:hypothetical protein